MRSRRPNMKLWVGQPVAAVEAKYDGHWLSIVKGKSPRCEAFLRKEDPEHEVSSKLRHLSWFPAVEAMLQSDTVLCGELYVPGQKASQVASHLARQSSELKLAVFAMPKYCGRDLTCQLPQQNHDWMRGTLGVALDTGGVSLSIQWSWQSFLEQTDHFHEEKMREICAYHEWEGFVFKEQAFRGWYKWKVEGTCDVICVGTVDGRGKYVGQVGALRGALWQPGPLWGPEVCRCSGMTDEEREEMTRIDERVDTSLVGRVFEVEYQYVGDGGRLRHPRFVRWRDDKTHEECGIEQFSEEDQALITAGASKKGK